MSTDKTIHRVTQPDAQEAETHRYWQNMPVTFDAAWENRTEGVIDGQVRAAVISRDDLIRNKLATGREQDILDVKRLCAIRPEDAS